MNRRDPTASGLPDDLQRLLDVYRAATAPGDRVRSRLWLRLVGPGAATVATTSAAFKVIVGGALLGVIAAVTIGVTRDAVAPTSRETHVAPAPRSEPQPQVSAALPPATLPSRAASPAPAPPPASPKPRGRTSAEPVPEEPQGLAEEIALLERARIALGHRRPEDALRSLAEHERNFASGALVEERMALRAVALCDSGELVEGRGEAQSFLGAHPGAALAGRIRDACEIDADGTAVDRTSTR